MKIDVTFYLGRKNLVQAVFGILLLLISTALFFAIPEPVVFEREYTFVYFFIYLGFVLGLIMMPISIEFNKKFSVGDILFFSMVVGLLISLVIVIGGY